jgi:predicted amidophosphoribosyltransferase
VFAVGNYSGALRKAIVAYKYGGERRWARPFARLLRDFLDKHATWFEEYSVLCPVPSFTGPGARRSWGPAELLCSELRLLAGGSWPVEALAAKVAETEPVSGRTAPQRRQIVAGPLRANLVVPAPSAVRGRKVLVVDDVVASGGTVRALGGSLRDAGADEVAALVLARACLRGPAQELAQGGAVRRGAL